MTTTARAHGRERKSREHRALLAARAIIDRMRGLYREIERSMDAPIAVHRVLACIGAQPGVAASKLADALGMQRSAISHTLNHLAQRGWIERVRNDADQRSVRISLTAAGKQAAKASAGRPAGALQRAVSRLDDAELDAFATAAERIFEHLPEPARTSATRKGASSQFAAAPRSSAPRMPATSRQR